MDELRFILIQKQISKYWGTVSTHWNANRLLEYLSVEYDKNGVKQELQYADKDSLSLCIAENDVIRRFESLEPKLIVPL